MELPIYGNKPAKSTTGIKFIFCRSEFFIQKKIPALTVIFFLILTVQAQNTYKHKSDSLIRVTESFVHDTIKIKAFNSLAEISRKKDNAAALAYAEKALQLSEQIEYKRGISRARYHMGLIYRMLGDYKKATELFNILLNNHLKANDRLSLAGDYINLAITKEEQGEYAAAMQYYLKAAGIHEENKDSIHTAQVYTNIGDMYRNMGDFKNAVHYNNLSMKIFTLLGNVKGTAGTINNIAITYAIKGDMDSAKYFFESALKLNREDGNLEWQANNLMNIGRVYIEKRQFNKTVEYFSEAEKLYRQMNSREDLAGCLTSYGELYVVLKLYDQALEKHFAAETIAKEINARQELLDIYTNIIAAAKEKKDYKTGFEYAERKALLKDSMMNEKSNNQIAEANVKFETEKKDREIETQKSEARYQSMIKNAFMGGLLLVLLLAAFILRSYLVKKKANKVLAEKNILIAAQKEIVEMKQKEILDSIHYARRIQKALITNEKYIERKLKHLQK